MKTMIDRLIADGSVDRAMMIEAGDYASVRATVLALPPDSEIVGVCCDPIDHVLFKSIDDVSDVAELQAIAAYILRHAA